MRNTPERLKALDNMVLAVKFFNEHCSDTGYQVEREIYDDDKYIDLRIRTPRDDEYAAYPEVYFKGDWYGTGMVCFESGTTGYGDHSLAQAQRAPYPDDYPQVNTPITIGGVFETYSEGEATYCRLKNAKMSV